MCHDFHTVNKACVKKGVHDETSWNYRWPALFSFSKLPIKLCGDVRAGGPVLILASGFLLLFSHSVVSDSVRHHGPQHTRLPCPSLSPGACSNSCPLSGWCHPTFSSSVAPFSSCLQSFPASGSFPISWLFASGGQSIGVSPSVSVLPVSIQG